MTINPQVNTSITATTNPFDLGDYTIFAGENNAGKTHLINAIQEEIGSAKTIYIPAEKINAEEQMKVSAAADPMRDAISKLVGVTVSSMPTINDVKISTLFNDIMNTFNSFNVPGTNLHLNKKSFTPNDFEKAVHDFISKKILEAKVSDTYNSSSPISLDVKSASQGTQRLIIVSIIQELGKVHVSGEEIFILFEEPEIYLHPRLKKSLYETLYGLSQNNIKVVITTHDPYFIELGKGQKIYEVYRNPAKDYSTDVKEIGDNDSVLGYKSDAEINFMIFGIPSKSYFLELYEHLMYLCMDKGLIAKKENGGYKELNQWLIEKGARKVDGKNTKLSKIRHQIGHPREETAGVEVTNEDIEELIGFIHVLHSD